MARPLTFSRLLLRSSPVLLVGAVVSSLFAGVISILLVASANLALRSLDRPGSAARYVALCAVLYGCELFSRMVLIRLGQRAIFDLRTYLVGRVLASPLRQLEELGSAKVFSAATENTFDIFVAIMHTPGLIAQSVVIVGCLGYCVVLWPIGGLAMVAILAAMVLLSKRVHRRGLKRLLGLHPKEQQLFAHIKALVEGAKELKLHRDRRAAFRQLFAETAAAVRAEQIRAMSIMQLSTGWGSVMGFALIGAAIFALPHLWPGVSAPVLGGFVIAFLVISAALGYVLTIMNVLGQANVAIAKMEALGLSVVDEALGQAEAASPAWRRIVLSGVTHSYQREGESSTFVVGPIDLTLHRGEIVFLVGGNGSGKSTLGKVLTGLYTPGAGEIRVDDQVVRDEEREAYRALFSAVFADFYLFDRLLGIVTPELDPLARAYLDKLGLAGKVSIEGGVLSTTALSSGQRKRLALLTAYLEDRPIYLFDEWAADQDPEFKDVFYRELLPELKQRGKTVIAITHDDRYFAVADRIVKLTAGRVVAEVPGAAAAPDAVVIAGRS